MDGALDFLTRSWIYAGVCYILDGGKSWAAASP